MNSKNELKKTIISNLKNEFKKCNEIELENVNLKLQIRNLKNELKKSDFKKTPNTKIEKIRQFMIDNKTKRKDVVRYILVELGNLDADFFEANYKKYRGHYSTNIGNWMKNGHLTKDENGFYVVTNLGKKAKSLYTLSDGEKIKRLKNRIDKLRVMNSELRQDLRDTYHTQNNDDYKALYFKLATTINDVKKVVQNA